MAEPKKPQELWPTTLTASSPPEPRGGFDDVALDRMRREAAERTQALAGEGQRIALEVGRQAREGAAARALIAAAETRIGEANQRLAIWAVIGLVAGTILVPSLIRVE